MSLLRHRRPDVADAIVLGVHAPVKLPEDPRYRIHAGIRALLKDGFPAYAARIREPAPVKPPVPDREALARRVENTRRALKKWERELAKLDA